MRPIGLGLFVIGMLLASIRAGQTAAAQDGTFYRFKNAEGRTVFVNDASLIPAAFRSTATPLDLSNISLNVELGNALRDEAIAEHERLRSQGICVGASQVVAGGRLAYAWDQYGPLIVVALAILALFLFSPFILKHVSGVVWARAVFMMVPTLAFVGVFAFIVVRTTRIVTRYREVASECADTPGPSDPVESHLQRLVNLDSAIERLRAEADWTTTGRGLDAR